MEHWLEEYAKVCFARASYIAHDMKTPLNIAVLNLELLKMRLRKLLDDQGEDEKIHEYARSMEQELRRMGVIFDAFFRYSSPPPEVTAPLAIPIERLLEELAVRDKFELRALLPARVVIHEVRLRDLLKLLFDGVRKNLEPGSATLETEINGGSYVVRVHGKLVPQDLELGKLFKFYYTDASGNPDLSLASARLIAETYGGALEITSADESVEVRLSLPQGE